MAKGPAGTPPEGDIRAFGVERLLAAVPGAAVLVIDLDGCVRFAEGDEFHRLGLDTASPEGRPLEEALPADLWAQLKGRYEGALAGRTSTFDFPSEEVVYSIRVSPRMAEGKIIGAVAVSQDVTHHRRLASMVTAQDGAAQEDERWFEMSNDLLATVSLDGFFTRLNSSWERCLGYSDRELMDVPCAELVHPDDLAGTRVAARSVADGPSEIVTFENRYRAKNGEWHWLLWTARSDGRQVYAVARDITERKEAELALQMSSQRLRSILDNTPGALSVKGRDHRYQLVNREFEQRFGLEADWIVGRRDEDLLPALAPTTLTLDRESDDLVLTTGELVEQERVITHDGIDRVQLTVRFPLRDEEGEIYAVCTIVSSRTDRTRNEDDLRDRIIWTERIRDAVAEGQLVLYAQPIVDLATGLAAQSELLVRMLDPDKSSAVIPPGAFLPAAERFGLVGAIDLWVVAQAVELAKRGHRVEINLSGKTVSHPVLIAEIERLVVTSEPPAHNIIFEITETAAVENLCSARDFAERLRALGCAFALDDFGVGFGAFTYLKHLRVDYLKIDIEFVRDLVSDEADRQVVRTIVGVARDFGIKTIAEGVENPETLELLRRMGVDYAQGYWTGRPLPVDVLLAEDQARGSPLLDAGRGPAPSQLPKPGRRVADRGTTGLTSDFGDALRNGDAKAAEAVADDALASGFDVAAVHARLIAPAMEEIGALWERDLISVGEEHLATAISHGVAARIFSRGLQATPRSRERVMLAAVQGERHNLGLRLVGDVLEGAGYEVLFLGGDVPLGSLLEACRMHEPAVLGLGVTIALGVPTLIWELEALMELEDRPAIMVGGRASTLALEESARAPVVSNSEHVLDIVAGLIAGPRQGAVVARGVTPHSAPALSAVEETGETTNAGFSATSLAAADAVREVARRAFGLERLAYRDGLTGLYNRRAFDDRFLQLTAEGADGNLMLMIDLDEFKSINDGYGHETGDEVLVSVARTILSTIRPGDFAARFGGDEFVVLLPGTTEADGASIAERIRAAVADGTHAPAVTISIGVASLCSSCRLTGQTADRALYRAKESGRNRVARSELVTAARH